jgi:hypothetical protein
MQPLHALDLTGSPRAEPLWRRRHDSIGEQASAHSATANDLDLPVQGFASPFGFWFAEGPLWKAGAPRLTVEFFELDDRKNSNHSPHAPKGAVASTCRKAKARLRTSAGRARDRTREMPLTLEIDSNVARIGVDSGTWSSVRETVLFAVAQYWRLDAIDKALDDLSDWARNDLEKNVGFAKALGRGRARGLRAHRRALEKLILDLPDHEGPLTNPRRHLPSGRAVSLYRRLSAWLDLHRRRREIDERIEVVESIFNSLAESLNHFQAMAFQIVLELIIVALLLLDVGLYFVDAIARHGP